MSPGWFQLLVTLMTECVPVQALSRVPLFATLRTVARQAPLSVGFSGVGVLGRPLECWNTGVGCWVGPPAGGLPHPGVERRSPALQAEV